MPSNTCLAEIWEMEPFYVETDVRFILCLLMSLQIATGGRTEPFIGLDAPIYQTATNAAPEASMEALAS